MGKYAFKPFPGIKRGMGIFVSSFYVNVGFIAINGINSCKLKIASYLTALVNASPIGYQRSKVIRFPQMAALKTKILVV